MTVDEAVQYLINDVAEDVLSWHDYSEYIERAQGRGDEVLLDAIDVVNSDNCSSDYTVTVTVTLNGQTAKA